MHPEPTGNAPTVASIRALVAQHDERMRRLAQSRAGLVELLPDWAQAEHDATPVAAERVAELVSIARDAVADRSHDTALEALDEAVTWLEGAVS